MTNLFRLRLILRNQIKLKYDHVKLMIFGNPVIIYQMPKTGSASLTTSVKNCGYPNTFHVHDLNPESTYLFDYPKNLSCFLYKKINQRNSPFKIITSVRDPIARNISDLFQILKICQRFAEYKIDHPFHSIIPSEYRDKKLSFEQIEELFLSYYPFHTLPLTWFDDNIKKVLNIDLYETPFPKESGHLTIEHQGIKILVLKLELKDSTKESIIKNFLEIPDFKIIKANVTSKEKFIYNDTYFSFIENLKLPLDYIDNLYSSRYMNHFYTPSEIDFFRTKWT